MVAGQYPRLRAGMTPALTVLQLDTHFPRIPGDVACPETYLDAIEIIRIPAASVGQIVTDDPGAIDIAPFEAAVRAARGAVVATSCGFLAHWQAHLQAVADRPVVASALTALQRISEVDQPVSILTFDAGKLRAGHSTSLWGHTDDVIGLRTDMHLRQVIERDARALDPARAGAEIAALVRDHIGADCKTLLLECTNLPPYKAAIRDLFDGQIIDILTEIEAKRPGIVKPEFL